MKSRAQLVCLVLVAASLLAVGQTRKSKIPTDVRVTVTVVNPKGEPVPNAGVVMKQASLAVGRLPKEPFHIEVKTDARGVAQVQGFAPGNVTVQVIATGFQTWGQTFVFKDTDEAVNVKLAPPQPQITIYH